MGDRPWRRASLAFCALMIVGGCTGPGGGTGPAAAPSTAATPEPVRDCASTGAGWTALTGVEVTAATLGRGPAVVFANDSGNDVCDWIPLAKRLAGAEYRVVVFEYLTTAATGEDEALAETLAVARAAADAGRFALVGASLGGRIVIEAAARHPAGLTSIVSLSGETTVEDYHDILPDARKVTTPALYVGARADDLTDGVKQQIALHRAMRGRPNELLQVDGNDHGTQLLDTGGPIADRVVAFLAGQR